MDAKRNFLEAALTKGMECKLITPEDVLRHIEPDVLASHLPDEAKTKLLSASLKAGKMNAVLVFETLDPRVFAEHMPEHMLWACVSEAATRALDGSSPGSRLGSASAKPASSLLGDSGSTRVTPRRPNATRRPARLSQQPASTRSKTKSGVDLEAELSSNWPKKDAGSEEEPFSDWVEETVTGAESASLTRRKR